jgi:thioredoxin 1
MPMNTHYAEKEPSRADVDALEGSTVVEFGTPWCGYCRGAQPLIGEAFRDHAEVRHIKIEDGSGRPLGRSFKVKLWPTLVFLRDGREVGRVVRPTEVGEVRDALGLIDGKRSIWHTGPT